MKLALESWRQYLTEETKIWTPEEVRRELSNDARSCIE